MFAKCGEAVVVFGRPCSRQMRHCHRFKHAIERICLQKHVFAETDLEDVRFVCVSVCVRHV